MLYHAEQFLANLDLLRTCVITGGKGTGKDMLACELSEHYLKQGYRFFTNQEHVWNDLPYIEEIVTDEHLDRIRQAFVVKPNGSISRIVEDNSFQIVAKTLFGMDIPVVKKEVPLKSEDIQEIVDTYYTDEKGVLRHRIANVKHAVIDLTEGGRYLRAWKYFENVYELSRKTDNYIFVPSIRLPHEELCEMVIENVFPFALVGLAGGGFWRWQVGGQNLKRPQQGWFLHWPIEFGLYDTKDYSFRPDEIIRWFTREIEGGDIVSYGVSRVASNSTTGVGAEADLLAAIARRNQNTAISLQDKN